MKQKEKMQKNSPKRSLARTFVSIISLGCPKNLVDSEQLAANLIESGFIFCEDARDAEIVIINTCCFVEEAERETEETISAMCRLKKRGTVKKVVVAGCLIPKEKKNLLCKFPDVDMFVPFVKYGEIGNILRECAEPGKYLGFAASQPEAGLESPRLLLTLPHSAYLRIAFGCSNRCSFCIIPQLRGRFRSKQPTVVLKEARQLSALGVKELNIIAQDTTAYGSDLKCDTELPALLRQLSAVKGIEWLRLLYANPARITDTLIETLATTENLIPYIDMPIQHINNRILATMSRRYRREDVERIIEKLRDAIPKVFIRTTIIVGFPGETNEEFEELLQFVEDTRFERLGVFSYSQEKGTRADKLANQIPNSVRKQRRESIMEVQQSIIFEKNRKSIGSCISAIVDMETGDEGFPFIGRGYGDAPGIDCRLFLKELDLTPGRIYNMKIVGTRGYDLIAEVK